MSHFLSATKMSFFRTTALAFYHHSVEDTNNSTLVELHTNRRRQATAMNPRKLASYGALADRGYKPAGTTHHYLRADNDGAFLLSAARATTSTDEDQILLATGQALSASSSASWSWFWAGLIAAAVATALSATVVVGVGQFAGYMGTGQSATVETAASITTAATATGFAEKSVLLRVDPQKQKKSMEDVGEKSSTLLEGGDKQLSFVASNSYTRRGDSVGVGYPWLEGQILVEPYRDTRLSVNAPVDEMSYRWKIFETNDGVDMGEFVGEDVDVVFKGEPKYTVVLLEQMADGTVAREIATEIFCKYVRREIRSLFDDERNELFDAMKVLWDLDLDEGQARFGEEFLDVLTINKFHQVAASDIECDHLHDGLGFGMGHYMVTLMFEGSLQAVNPKLSVPYWDFTIESYLVDTQHDGDYNMLREVSDMWTSDWFGGTDDTDFQVKDGRWAFLSVPRLSVTDADILGADVFGRMRSPWNVNDRLYLTRGLGEMCGASVTDYYEWPTCEVHYQLQKTTTSLYGYTWKSQYDPHGPVHIWIGGTLDCENSMDILASIFSPEDMTTIMGTTFLNRKDLFRDGIFKCAGRAKEKEDYTTVFDNVAGIWSFMKFTDDEKRTIAIQHCSGLVAIGESSQSSSPIDPVFWSMHPTMERLFMFKRITGTMTDLSWPDEPGLWTGDDGTVYDVITSLQSDTCNGHRGSDVFPYGTVEELMTPHFTFFGKTGPNTLTNRELVHLFDPSANALTYVYDNFEWPHCTAQGYDMNDLFADAPMESRESRQAREELDYGLFPSGERHKQLYGKRSLHHRLNEKA